MKINKLPQSFYNQHVVDVARNLLGKKLVFNSFEGIITEVEAYRGADDEASHAYRHTNRSSIMFGPSGFVYVYLIYGMYYCLNIVTEEEGSASAVLIRGLKLPDIHLNGPGKICRHLGITKDQQGINVAEDDNFYIAENELDIPEIFATPRIGITKAKDRLWRFYIAP